MKLPNSLLAKTSARFDALVAEGQSILAAAKEVPAEMAYDELSMSPRPYETRPAYILLNHERFVEWRTKAATLLARVVPKGHVHRSAIEKLPELPDSNNRLKEAISLLKGVKDDLEQGFLDDLASEIEAAIAADYMGQAENLLGEGQRGRFDHVPAAVLAGAVLEKALRTLCSQQSPPIPTVNAKGEPKTLNPLIDDLRKAGAFIETKAKQLRAWAAIRNHAAHGEFDQFARTDVEAMIPGINTFLADYLN
jgi:hypothetical protein